MKKIFKQIIFSTLFFSFGVFLFLLVHISYAGWVNFSSNNPPQLNVAGPITTGPAGQIKLGRLDLNTNKTALSGLELIRNSSNASIGLVGLGTNNPQELLDIKNGNVGLTGSLIMNSAIGFENNLLTNDGGTQLWRPDTAWLTIQRIDTYDTTFGACVEVFPVCPSGWTVHELFPATPPPCTETPGNSSIGKQTRICKKDF